MKSAVKSHRKLLEALLSRDKRRITAGVNEHLTPEAVIPPSIAE
jgi:hypothetical protein